MTTPLALRTLFRNPRLSSAFAIALLLSPLPSLAARPLSDDDARSMVVAHNRWRRPAGLPDLRWNATLAARAQAWADHLATHEACDIAHSDARDVGENLFWASAVITSSGARHVDPLSPADVVNAWAAEGTDYDRKRNRCAPGTHCGHYTQLMWKTTRELGCGRVVCDAGQQAWVCQYSPAGNLGGKRPF